MTCRADLQDLIDRYLQMRRHYTRVCGETYAPTEQDTVGGLVDDLAAEISARVTNWRTSEHADG